MDNDNFSEVINVRKITEAVLEYIDSQGFTTDVPVDPEALRNNLDYIIRDRLGSQGVHTYSFGSE